MVKKGITLMFLAFSLYFPGFTFAETIVLKSGRTIEGQIVEKTADYIKVKEGTLYFTYYLNKIESIDGKKVESKKNSQLISQTTVSLPEASTQEASEVESTLGAAVTKQFDELFVEQCLEFFKNRDYAAFYGKMSSQAKKTAFQDMVNLFSAEEKILGPLKEYRKFDRSSADSSFSHSIQASFRYVCVFEKSEGVATVGIVTENKELKVISFNIISPAFFTKEAKALLAEVKVEPE